MPVEAWLLAVDHGSVDRCLMQSLMLFSSSETARVAAAAWLAEFEAARAAGATAEGASAIASRAPPARLPACG